MKKYCIIVEGFSVEKKEDVLQCLYELGYSWSSDGDGYTGCSVKYYVTCKGTIKWGDTTNNT